MVWPNSCPDERAELADVDRLRTHMDGFEAFGVDDVVMPVGARLAGGHLAALLEPGALQAEAFGEGVEFVLGVGGEVGPPAPDVAHYGGHAEVVDVDGHGFASPVHQ
jgi:hypothetical protein